MLDYPKVKSLLRKQGFTQKEVASELGVSATAVSDWLKGEAQPSQEHLEGLASFLDCSVEELYAKPHQITSGDRSMVVVNFYGDNNPVFNLYGESEIESSNNLSLERKSDLTISIDPEILQHVKDQDKTELARLVNELLKKHFKLS